MRDFLLGKKCNALHVMSIVGPEYFFFDAFEQLDLP